MYLYRIWTSILVHWIWSSTYHLRYSYVHEVRKVTNPIQDLHKAFDNRVRLGIMSSLMANSTMDFKSLKSLLAITDGNLASHLKALEKEEFISVHKSFKGRKPHTTYQVTTPGQGHFIGYNFTDQQVKDIMVFIEPKSKTSLSYFFILKIYFNPLK